MSYSPGESIVLDVLHSVETRNRDRLAALYHPQIEFEWPPALPYGGIYRGAEVARMSEVFAQVWIPLQPTEAERRLQPTIVASGGEDVVAHYIWKGRDAVGRRFATSTLAHYKVRDQKLARAQMFHFDLTGLVEFLSKAHT